MTVEAWTLILQAVLTVLVVTYGIWLRNIVKQQIDAKEATIQSLQTQIAGLKQEVAPAIVTHYQTMRAHAEEMTGEVQRLKQELQETLAQQEATEDFKRFLYVAGSAVAYSRATTIIGEHIGKRLFEPPAPKVMPSVMQLGDGYLQAVQELSGAMQQSLDEAKVLFPRQFE